MLDEYKYERRPRPLTLNQIILNQGLLASSRVASDFGGYLRGHFEDWGGFKIKRDDSASDPDEMWSERLLFYDAETERIKTSSNGALWVIDRARDNLIETAGSEKTRLVDKRRSGPAVVQPNGFVLKPEKYVLAGKSMSPEEFEGILVDAVYGKQPEEFQEEPFMRVDPQEVLPGTEVRAIFFQADPREEWWRMDGVVVLPNRLLASKQFLHPLHHNRWRAMFGEEVST